MLIENEVLNVRVVEEQKNNGLAKKLGDYCLGFSAAAGIALFVEVMLKNEIGISVERAVISAVAICVFFVSGIIFSIKGGK